MYTGVFCAAAAPLYTPAFELPLKHGGGGAYIRPSLTASRRSRINLPGLATAGWAGVRTRTALQGRKHGRHRQSGGPHTTELLVDADASRRDDIESAVEQLSCDSHEVRTVIYAEPGRRLNTEWNELAGRPGYAFRPVSRDVVLGEPNDRAIQKHLRSLVSEPSIGRVALMTADTDFVEDMRSIALAGKESLVFVSSTYAGAIEEYRMAGIKVVQLELRKQLMYKVRAVLNTDGSGFVEKCAPISHATASKEVEMLKEFLCRWGYTPHENVFLPTAIAKFFFTNSLGPLTVYPSTSCFMEAHRIAAASLPSHAWQSYHEEIAFFLPHGSATRSRISKTQRKTYGTPACLSFFRGVGPFMLTQKSDLVKEALQRLGFLDDHYNADLFEAMLVFANTGFNKKLLRKTAALPEPGDSSKQLADKFMRAFLSSATSGQWQMAQGDAQVRRLLLKENLITAQSAPRAEMLEAMQRLSKKVGLPKRKTYNGVVWQILLHINQKDPLRRMPLLL
ncbi:unnamed protein product [Symbiodinium natans]|uniref:NYN domain-containing protein n=1 Tax=Symbiodinium natans TaxID=878477 RepID=A0A812GAM9_9DINO|nr:unnamed protein product [Symbiodinium natans]